MEQYLINDTTLSDIADALRRQHGEVSIFYDKEIIESPPVISKTPNALSFTEYDGGYGDNRDLYDVVNIPGAHTIKVKMQYQTEAVSWDYIQITTGKTTSMPSTVKKYGGSNMHNPPIEIEFPDTDTITFYFHSDGSSSSLFGYYAECTGFDEDGNPVKETIYIPYEVPNIYKPSEMPAAIDAIKFPTIEALEVNVNGTYTPGEGEGVGGFNPVIVNVPSVPSEALIVSGDCGYRFSQNGWNWFVEDFGDSVITENIANMNSMFYSSSKLTKIPMVLNINPISNVNMNNAFSGCNQLTNFPKIINAKPSEMSNLFYNCNMLREMPDDFCDTWDWSYIEKQTSAYNGNRAGTFNGCYSLRKFPMEFLRHCNYKTTNSYSVYYNVFSACHSLDEVIDFPVLYTPDKVSAATSNYFNYTVNNCYRLKNFTFETNEDGSPIVVNWKSQVLDFTQYVGYVNNVNYIIQYNSGITTDKAVGTDAAYAALKDDPDWYATVSSYSRYNRVSAVNTINSLPDTSAYLATAGGTNTIKFKSSQGSRTDGGDINTLTAEEIAVAAAKGWTVSFA